VRLVEGFYGRWACKSLRQQLQRTENSGVKRVSADVVVWRVVRVLFPSCARAEIARVEKSVYDVDAVRGAAGGLSSFWGLDHLCGFW